MKICFLCLFFCACAGSSKEQLEIAAGKPGLSGIQDSTNLPGSDQSPPDQGVNQAGDPTPTPPPTPTPTPPQDPPIFEPPQGDWTVPYDATPDYEVHPTLGWRRIGTTIWTLDCWEGKCDHPLVSVLEDAPVKPGETVVMLAGQYGLFTIDPKASKVGPWDPPGYATTPGGTKDQPITLQAAKDSSKPSGYADVVIGSLNQGAMFVSNGASFIRLIGITFQASGQATVHMQGDTSGATVKAVEGWEWYDVNMLGNWNPYSLKIYNQKYGIPTQPPFSAAHFSLICDLQTDSVGADPVEGWGEPMVAGDKGVKWGLMSYHLKDFKWYRGVAGPIMGYSGGSEHIAYLHNSLGNIDIRNLVAYAFGRTFVQILSRQFECPKCGPNPGWVNIQGNVIIDGGSQGDGGSNITIAGGQAGDVFIRDNIASSGFNKILLAKGEGGTGRGFAVVWDGGKTKEDFGGVPVAWFPYWQFSSVDISDINLFPSYPYLPANPANPYDPAPNYNQAVLGDPGKSGLQQNGNVYFENNIFVANTDLSNPEYAPWVNTKCGAGAFKKSPDREMVAFGGARSVTVRNNTIQGTTDAFRFDNWWDNWGTPIPFSALVQQVTTYGNIIVGPGKAVDCLQNHPGFPGTHKACPDPTKAAP